MGEVFNRNQQKQIFLDCMKILETATTPGEIIDSKYHWGKTSLNNEKTKQTLASIRV